ncbi:MAG TPA: ABC transporter substrate-binding protein [Xanthobacteraceae bacterium]|nr:ABC transporter substrate-binding protein [Xanthobacteraceae bacterium]
MRGFKVMMMAGVLAAWAGGAMAETTLRIGLAEDPDILDPTLARTYVGRIVFAGICDKLFDITADLKIVPQLATGYSWSADNKALTVTLRSGVKFQDGEPMDAAAVKYSIERHLKMPGSNRKAEIGAVTGVDVVDDHTVKLNLASPFAPLLAQLTDRAGMIVSPKAAAAAGDKFGNHPVCAGPYKFVERVAQDRIVLDKFADYWDKDNVHIDKVIYQPIPDSTVRLANLRSGQLDFIEGVAATDIKSIEREKKLKINTIVSLGYDGITINLANGDMAKNPLGQDPRVRQAFELSLDRDAINQVVFEGQFLPGNQWVSPQNPYYAKNDPVPKRDVAKAKALLKAAGVPNPSFTLMVPIGPENERAAQVIQSMAKEAGFDIKLQVTEFARALELATQGKMEAFYVGWSGRTDPDGNLYSFLACGAGLNDGHYCNQEVQKELDLSRMTADPAERLKHYEAIAAQAAKDEPIIYLFHRKRIYAYSPRLTGFTPIPDGLVRVKGLTLQ